MMRHAQGADQQKLLSPAEYLRREQILSFFSRITASRQRNMSFKDMLGQGSDTEDADCDIEECLEELEAEQDLAFLKEQIDDPERNDLHAEDTSVLPHSEPQECCRMQGRLKCILIAAVCFKLLQFAMIWSCSDVWGHC